MDEHYFKNGFQATQLDSESDSLGGDVSTRQSILGDIVIVRVRQSLDLTVFFTFMSAAQKASSNPRTELILVDLGETQVYFESGSAMLRLLREQLPASLKDRIFLINANPEIRQRLELELPPAQFHIGVSEKVNSSVKLH